MEGSINNSAWKEVYISNHTAAIYFTYTFQMRAIETWSKEMCQYEDYRPSTQKCTHIQRRNETKNNK